MQAVADELRVVVDALVAAPLDGRSAVELQEQIAAVGPQLARLTAHEIGRYMGLSHNVEVDPRWRDGIDDSDASPANLMFYSELGGTDLSPGQRAILQRSPVLR